MLVLAAAGSAAVATAQPGKDQALLNDGKVFIFDRKWDQAHATFQRLVQLYPESQLVPQAYYYSARCGQFQGRQEEALRAYEQFLQLFPNEPFLRAEARNAVVELAASLLEKGNFAYRDRLISSLGDPDKELRYFAAIRCSQVKDRAITSMAVPVLKEIVGKGTSQELVDRARIALLRLEPAALPPPAAESKKRAARGDDRLFHLVVHRRGSAQPLIELNIPVSLAQMAVSALDESAKREMRRKGIDVDNIWGDLKRLGPTNILTFRDGENLVKLWIE
jgi:tetratricopeptide (TPR) repeat protein